MTTLLTTCDSSPKPNRFTLNTSYDHGCHLTNRFRLDPEEYDALLIVAGLALYTRFGWLPNQGHGQLVVTLPLLVLSLRRLLVLSSRRLVVACGASRRAALSSSCRLVVLTLVLSRHASWLSHHHLSLSSCCTALSPSHRVCHNDCKGKQGDRRHDDGDWQHDDIKGRHGDGKRHQGDRRHDDGDVQHDDGDGRHDGGRGQHGARWHDNGDGRHNDGRHDDGRHDDGKGQQGDWRHDDGDERHDDGKGWQVAR